MPQAVTHVLIPIILLSLFRDIFFKGKKKEKFPLHYVLIGGLAGALPDLDLAIYYILSYFGFSIDSIHRTFSHNIFVPLFFVCLALIFYKFKNKELGRHHLKLNAIFLVIAFGISIHLLLDYLLSGSIMPIYPLSSLNYGLNSVKFLPQPWQSTFIPVLDAALLILWLIYLEIKHKISSFI